MPIYSSIGIQKSVGKHGQNMALDVRCIQTRLNDLMGPSRIKLIVDGKTGPKTNGMIYDFQKNVVPLLAPDSRVDPNGKTILALNDPASEEKWRRMSVALPPGAPGAVPFEAEMQVEFEKFGKPLEFNDFRRILVDGSIPRMKIFLGSIGRAEDARTLVRVFLTMRSWGLTAKEATIVFKAATGMRNQKAALKLFSEMGNPVSKVGRAIGKLGKGAGLVGHLVSLIEVADKFEQGDYLYGLTELYKYAMGKAVPWAGMVEGLQSLVEAILPNSSKNSMIFKLIRACDPIGLGATGVDAMTTLTLGTVDMIVKGRIDYQRLDRLVNRMKQGPTKVFADMGEDLGDATYEMSKWKRSDWSYAVKSVPGWIASWFD